MVRPGLSGEAERIERLQRILGRERAAGVIVGIGDDAAVLAPGEQTLVWTVDVQVEHVHFELAWLSFEELGFRATMAAASDLAAMAASPAGVLASLVLPPGLDDSALDAMGRGQARACDELGTSVVGGNLSRGSELSITTTVLGRAPRTVQRSGARPGDAVLLSGPVGLAAAGLEICRRAQQPQTAAEHAASAAWRQPRARIAEGLRLGGAATAAIDLSDGLACDGARIARASEAPGPALAMALNAPDLVSPELAAVASAL